jgi:ubiquitin-like modifier-activating enzyme ATG7
MASALLVETLVSILQHPLGAQAPAPKTAAGQTQYERDPPSHPLGLVPHQIRGFLANFNNMMISGQSYDCCSACSPKIVDAYKNDGWEFIKRALTEKDYISELSGLAQIQRDAEAAAVDWDSEPGLGDDNDDEGELL